MFAGTRHVIQNNWSSYKCSRSAVFSIRTCCLGMWS